jgi:cobyrinic acid a,c-diamide synthase
MHIPGIVIAGTNSGCGKTTVSMGIMAALVKRGLCVQPYKVGPDYIDPMFHTFITGRDSRNLDSWMLGEETVTGLFCKNAIGADFAVIEGVMGMFDGFGGYSEGGSTAHVSKIVGLPVILVVNGEGMSLSIVPLIKGFLDFDPGVKIRGVIINNINSDGHFQLLRRNIEEHLDIAVLGYLKTVPECTLPSRHLGLVTEGEISDLKNRVDILSRQVEETLNLELLQRIAQEAAVPIDMDPIRLPGALVKEKSRVRIGIAKDKAFNFYYRDNLDLLEILGAELVYFSPLTDKELPSGLQGLYIGGGYPEVWAKELEANGSMRRSIREHIKTEMPTFAECGGLMYLGESIRLKNGEAYAMAGVIPGKSEMTSSLQRFGYVEIEATADSCIIKAGERIRGHEFHYSTTAVAEGVPGCFQVSKSRRDREAAAWTCGFQQYNVVAGYPHLHFWSNPAFAERFVEKCREYGVGSRE